MQILLGLAIALTVFLQVLLAQPIPASEESADSKQNAASAYIFKEAKLVADKIETVIKKSLPHIPQSPENEVYRDYLNEMLQLKQEYKDAELKDDCGEKAIKVFEHQSDFIRYYVMGVSSAPELQEVREIMNEYGLQEIKDYFDEVRKVDPVDEPILNKYVIEHCKL